PYVALIALVSSPLAAQTPVAHAISAAAPPVIDGRLTDPAWASVPPITGFIQRELHEGQPITQRTEVRIITDGQALYVGAWLYDSDPSGIVTGAKVRDGDITKSDYFGILLDTYRDRQNGIVFTTTPAAIEYDAFRIPFTTLRYGSGKEQTWGLNLVRSIRRKNEEAFWSFIPRQFSLMKISRAGTLAGVQAPSRRVLTLTPY